MSINGVVITCAATYCKGVVLKNAFIFIGTRMDMRCPHCETNLHVDFSRDRGIQVTVIPPKNRMPA